MTTHGNTKYPMKCRYSPDHHGDFANAVALRQHYDAQHAHEYAPADKVRVTCNLCGNEMLLSSFASHKAGVHNGVEARYTIQGTVVPKKVVKALVPLPNTAPAPSRPAERHTAPDPGLFLPPTVDHIVLPAIELMARPGQVVPVSALAALFAWRDATAVMLREVSGQ